MSFTFLYTLRRSDNNALIADADVTLFSDAGMTTTVDSARTSALGVATFLARTTGTYYARRMKAGYSGVNPQTITLLEGTTESASGTLTPISVADAATVQGVFDAFGRTMRDDQAGKRWNDPMRFKYINLAGRQLRRTRRDAFLAAGDVDQEWSELSLLTEELPVAASFTEALAAWMARLAFMEEDPETQNLVAAQRHGERFYELVGVRP